MRNEEDQTMSEDKPVGDDKVASEDKTKSEDQTMSDKDKPVTNGLEEEQESVLTRVTDLSLFSLTRVLGQDTDRKVIFVEARVKGSDHPAVLSLEKLPFSKERVGEMMGENSRTRADTEFINDVYGQFSLRPQPELNTIKANLIHPASEKHLAKYLSSPPHLVVETPEVYRGLTLPHLVREQFSLQWVYNVLEHRKEVERIIFEDPDPNTGFILAPDFKWSGNDVSDLYCLAIVHKRGIRSLRDLTSLHLPLLRNIMRQATQAIQEKYGLKRCQIRAYLHYQPSYYHLHVHLTSLTFSPPGSGCEKSHMLDSVISNIEMDPNYYQKATLPFLVREKESLYTKYKQAGHFQPKEELLDICSRQFEPPSSDLGLTIKFAEMLGRAKHEPCGQFWETTYGESSWRLTILCLCLPDKLDRRRLVGLALASGLASIGSCNDENTEWAAKIREVGDVLFAHLPTAQAGLLLALFEEHAGVRRGKMDGTREHEAYRGVLELEETLLRWEEEVKEGVREPTDVEQVIRKMARVRFPGWQQLDLLRDAGPLTKLLKFLLEVSRLQRLKRTGWVRCGVREPETVAGHMFRMGVLGLLLGGVETAVICLCHDMAECVIGDITPHCKVSLEDKADKEMAAFKGLVKDLPSHVVGDLLGAFQRYEEQKEGDLEARLTKDLDKFDMILQAWEYEKRDKKGSYLQQFFDSTMDVFTTVPVSRWQKHLLESREKHFSEA